MYIILVIHDNIIRKLFEYIVKAQQLYLIKHTKASWCTPVLVSRISMVRVMVCRLFGAMPLPEQTLT